MSNISTVNVNTGRPYQVLIGNNLLAQLGKLVGQFHSPCSVVIVADDIVNNLYGDKVAAALDSAGYRVSRFVFPHGEQNKNMEQLNNLLRYCTQAQLTRTDLIIALGGGVTGDLAGFAAAIYLRGIDYIQLPTTFLAAIDSSVGGKTAVDLPEGKNLVGAFWQPLAVICDIDTLDTLSEKVFADGTAEAVKYGILADADLFKLLAAGNFRQNLQQIIRRSVEIKAEFVRADERDSGCRQQLNLGHTIGHAIEQCSGYSITHGHAVAIGMAVIARCAAVAGFCSSQTAATIKEALIDNNLPLECPYYLKCLLNIMYSDKKRRGSLINLVIPQNIGKCRLLELSVDKLEDFIAPGLA